MADDEKSPLLKFSDDDEHDGLHHRRPPGGGYRGVGQHIDGKIAVSASMSTSSLAEPDHVVCVFVVTFDTRSGDDFITSKLCHLDYLILDCHLD